MLCWTNTLFLSFLLNATHHLFADLPLVVIAFTVLIRTLHLIKALVIPVKCVSLTGSSVFSVSVVSLVRPVVVVCYALTPTRCTTSFRFWLPLNTSPFLLCIILPSCDTIHAFSPRGWDISPLSAQGNDLCLTPIQITKYDLVEESESVGKRFARNRVMTVNHGLQSAAGIYSVSVQCTDRT